jgi:hypothetical protein
VFLGRVADRTFPLIFYNLSTRAIAVLGQSLVDEQHSGPWQFAIHVPLYDGLDNCASPWMAKVGRRQRVA